MERSINSAQQSNPLLTISCRFVPYDQWLVTHCDPGWKIKQVKLWILARCLTSRSSGSYHTIPSRHRPSSPITFAPHPSQRPISPIRFAVPDQHPRTSFNGSQENWDPDENDDEHTEGSGTVEDDSDYLGNKRWSNRRDQSPYSPVSKLSLPNSRASIDSTDTSPISDPYCATQYTLVRFATGQILEDDFPLSWYAMHPFELLEVHRAGIILQLPRGIAHEYILPYFEAHVKCLRVVNSDGYSYAYGGNADDEKRGSRMPRGEDKKWQEKEKRKTARVKEKAGPGTSVVDRGKSKKSQVEWKEQWLVICSGVLNLCKDENDSTPQRLPLSALTALRGPEHITGTHLLQATSQRHIICANFRLTMSPTSKNESEIKEKAGRADKGSAVPTRGSLGPEVGINARPRSDQRVGAQTITTANDRSSSPTHLRSMSLEGEEKHTKNSTSLLGSGADLSRDKARSRVGQGARPSRRSITGVSSTVRPSGSSSTTGTARPPGTVQSGRNHETRVTIQGETEIDVNVDGGEWVILDMLNDDAYSNLIRVLHRHFPLSTSSFIRALSSSPTSTPANTPIASPTSPLSPTSSSNDHLDRMFRQQSDRREREDEHGVEARSEEDMHRMYPSSGHKEVHPSMLQFALPRVFGPLPYPEWRTELVRRAQRAGIGGVGQALGWVLSGDWEGISIVHDCEWGGEEADNGSSDGTLESARSPAGGIRHRGDSSPTLAGTVHHDSLESEPEGADGETDDTYSDDDSERSEVEWMGWVGDLERQARVHEVLEREGWETQLRARIATKSTGGHIGGHASSQRLFQQGKRALEPSAVVTPLLNIAHPSPLTSTSSSSRSLGTQWATTEELPSSSVSSGFERVSLSGHKEVIDGPYARPLKSTLSIETVLRRNPGVTNPAQTEVSSGVGPKNDRGLSSPPPRQRSATVNYLNSSPNPSPSSGVGDGGLASMFSRRKGREYPEDEKEDERPKLSLAFPPFGLAHSGRSSNSGLGSTSSQQLSPALSSAISPPKSRPSILRHVRSGSSLYGGCVGSTSLLSEDSVMQANVIGLGGNHGNSGSATGGAKKTTKKGLVRGVSARAGKLVDAAVDFVDAR